jgi:hypothetical protein
MLKFAMLAIIASLSLNAFATSQVTITPTSPIVSLTDMTLSDGNVITAPWIHFDTEVVNDQEIVVSGLHFEITSSEGMQATADLSVPLPYDVPANAPLTFKDLYLGQLPSSKSTIYNVTVMVVGTMADKTTPISNIGTNFQTQ